MQKKISMQIIQNPKLLSHFMEHSYWIKELNRQPKSFKVFIDQMKMIYKERATDKLNQTIDGIEMLSTLIEATK